jgi:nitrogen fixation/metabolism regulation signal transduction histidine kinase
MSLEDKRIPFAIEAHDRNLEIDCRPGQIQQVLVNLLRNAIEAQTKNDHNAWISLLVFDDEKNISFVIQDNGCGFTSEYLEQQNDVLYKMNSSVQHFGLGLNYVKKIIADHGGTLIIEQLKSPTSVRVILPKKQAIKIPELKKSA